jgi:hypothetical protein
MEEAPKRSIHARGLALLIDCLAVLGFGTYAIYDDTAYAYALAGVATLRLMFDIAMLRARSAGAPTWSADEAYVTRWLRWWRSRSA